MKYQQFIFENYEFDEASKTLALHYSLDGELSFTETYKFDFEFVSYEPLALERAIEMLFFMAGVSYYKTFLPPEIIVRQGRLDASAASLLGKTWQKGLGEFFYVNQLDPNTSVKFPVTSEPLAPIEVKTNDLLVGIGGGKDSLTSVEMLRNQNLGLATWSLSHRQQLAPQVERIGLKHYFVEREFDQKLIGLADAYNGHIPISAIIACAGAVVAILTGRRDVVVSNEQSANEPTLEYRGVAINHQYSKSQEFERDFRKWLVTNFGASIRYYSLLRPLGELKIAEIFSRYFDKYHDVFSSCNRAFTHASDHLFWDGACPKCAFVFLALTPFVAREKLEKLFSGKNLLADASLEPTYRQLLGIEGDKPLECVGEVAECRAAMKLASKIYPELVGKYQFDLPEDYDFRALASDEMPPEMRSIVDNFLKS